MNLELQRGQESHILTAQSHDLSRDGISLVAHQFIDENTRCRVRMVTEGGALHIVDGYVARCVSLERTPQAYEVGVRFSSPIDIQLFCPNAVSVHVLVLDNDDLQKKILDRVLTQSGAVAHFCSSADEAIEKALSTSFELIIANFDAEGLDACRFIRELRAQRYLRPIVSVSCFEMAHAKHTCKASQCESCRLIELDWDALGVVAGSLRTEPVTTSLPPTRDTVFLVNKFVFSLQDRISELERSFSDGDVVRTVGLARRLAMMAESCGFESIMKSAAKFAELVQKAGETAPYREQVNALVRLCLSARPTTLIDPNQTDSPADTDSPLPCQSSGPATQ